MFINHFSERNRHEFRVGHSSNKFYYTRDHLGSIRELIDQSGAVRARYDYDAYGVRTKTGGDMDADFGYTGHYQHAPSGLTLTWFRAYDPAVGRWLSRDPIKEQGGINLYGYVGNDPVNLMDLLGLCDDLPSAADCAAEAFLGISAAAGGSSAVASLPVIPKPWMGDATRHTSLASKCLSKALPMRLPFRVPTPTLAGMVSSNVAGRIAGRWIPVVGWGLLAFDAARFSLCLTRGTSGVYKPTVMFDGFHSPY